MTFRQICATGLILTMLLGCGEKADQETTTTDKPASVSESDDLAGRVSYVLPRTEELNGFEKASSDRLFDPEGLGDYLGEDASAFVEYGVSRAVVADYKSVPGEHQYVIDVYMFGSVSDAFGMYARLRSPDVTILDVGAQGFIEGGSLVFFKGDFLLKATAYTQSAEEDSALVYLAIVASNRIDSEAAFPEAIELFPAENKLDFTEAYYPSKFLDYDFFSPTYTCDYKLADSVSTLFFIPRGSPAEVIQYTQILTQRGNKVFEGQEGELTLYFCDDDRKGRVIVSTRGGRLAGVVNTPDRDHGLQLLRSLWDNVLFRE